MKLSGFVLRFMSCITVLYLDAAGGDDGDGVRMGM